MEQNDNAAKLTTEKISNAVRNDYGGKCFQLGNRIFEVRDLDYDAYMEFCELARPIIEAVTGAIDFKTKANGELDLQFDATGIDVGQVLSLAKKELPRMAWLCCKQSDPKIKIEEVKQLARRPMVMLEVVLAQIKHNELVKEFADFFPRLAQSVTDLIPAASTTTTESTENETPTSS